MINFNDFKEEYYSIGSEIESSIQRVISSGWYILGKELNSFEKMFAKYLGVKFCLGVGSGTDALSISLKSLGIGIGDEVITSSFTAYPTITGIINSGATPVLVDINIENALMNYKFIEEKINKKTKAILPVHLYGQCCDIHSIQEIASKYKLKIVEDCAQSAGATYKNRKAGTFGDIGAFSFYPTKNLGAYGDAGAITTDSEDLYLKAKLIRNYGQEDRYNHKLNGYNSRLDEIQAAILSTKLKYLDEWNKKRFKIASKYRKNLKNVNLLENNLYCEHVYHLFVVKSNNREKLMGHLNENDIQTLIHYPRPVNREDAFSKFDSYNFQNAEQLSKQIFSLPNNPWLKDDQTDFIIESINNFPNEK